MRVGEERVGKVTIAPFLQAGHYKLARLKEGKRWPPEWVNAEAAEVMSQMLRASGGSSEPRKCGVEETPCKASFRILSSQTRNLTRLQAS